MAEHLPTGRERQSEPWEVDLNAAIRQATGGRGVIVDAEIVCPCEAMWRAGGQPGPCGCTGPAPPTMARVVRVEDVTLLLRLMRESGDR